MFDEMDKIKEDPFQYLEEYKMSFIIPNLEKIEKEEKQKDIIPLIKEKIKILWINLMSCSPKK